MTALESVKKRIRENGPLSFRDFMAHVLYDPQTGYYLTSSNRVGMQGDFYTSPCYTPLFGEMLAVQIEEIWKILQTRKFSIVEFGGAKGQLCLDVLAALQHNRSLYKQLHYYIIDKSVDTPAAANAHFQHEKVSWLTNTESLNEIEGCILSNELVDNFPVHRVVMLDQLKEIYVDYRDSEFYEILKTDEGILSSYFNQMNVQLPYGCRTEVNLDALHWLQQASRLLRKGFIITIDYGYRNNELYEKNTGTLACYYRHSTNGNPYAHIGDQDITSHVNFSALCHWGHQYLLETTGFTTQQFFLQSLGIANHIRKMEATGKTYARNHTQLLRLTYDFLVRMSSKFKVLVQQKSMLPVSLQGLKFSMNPD